MYAVGIRGSATYATGVYGSSYSWRGIMGLGNTYCGIWGSNGDSGYYSAEFYNPDDAAGAIWAQGYVHATNFYTHKKMGKETITLGNVSSLNNLDLIDFGTAELTNGAAIVELKPELTGVLPGKADYVVIVTPGQDCNGLAVVDKTVDSFRIIETGNGDGQGFCDYIVIMNDPATLRHETKSTGSSVISKPGISEEKYLHDLQIKEEEERAADKLKKKEMLSRFTGATF